MAGHQSFENLRARLSPERQARVMAMTDDLDRDLSLAELRGTRALTQSHRAADLHVEQASIEKLKL